MKTAKVEHVETTSPTVEAVAENIRIRNAAPAGLLPEMSESTSGGKKRVPKVQDREHSKISPSRMKDLEICPEHQNDDKAPLHPITVEGLLCHKAVETGDWSKLTTDEQRIWCRDCMNYTDRIIKQYDDRGSKPEVLKEVKLPIIDRIWGFADLIIMDKDHTCADLVDYKFATQLQEDAETNPQGASYVLGLFKKFETLKLVILHFIYPRLGKASTHAFHRSEMLALELRLSTIIERVKQGGYFNPHPDVCTYCLQKGVCTALHQMILPIAKRYDDGHEKILPAVPDFSKITSPDKFAALMAWAPVLEETGKSIKRHATEFHRTTGQEIPGYDLVKRDGVRKIHNPLLAWELAQKEGVSQQAFLGATEVSTTKLLNAVSDTKPRGEKGTAKQAFEDALRDAGVLEIGEPIYFLAKQKQQ